MSDILLSNSNFLLAVLAHRINEHRLSCELLKFHGTEPNCQQLSLQLRAIDLSSLMHIMIAIILLSYGFSMTLILTAFISSKVEIV